MSDDIVISAEGLGKKYIVGHDGPRERYATLRDVIARAAKGLARSAGDMIRGRPIVVGDEVEEFWALKDVSFEVKRGEVLGIIGRNGAGKSTLLKILSRITEPTEGRVTIKGRVASLLEVGTGFHPELTGRENIYLNGAILGMTRAEIRRKFDEIVAFAEVERFIDTPVKRYSSGMYVRLAFAVAAHLEPEILVIDEVLAVGDAEFQKKCLGKMSEIAGAGRTVLFVSHNMAAVEALCPRAIRLDSGAVVDDRDTDSVVATYLAHRQRPKQSTQALSKQVQAGLTIEEVAFDRPTIRCGEPAEVSISFRAEMAGNIRECALLIHSIKGLRVAIVDARESGVLPYRYRKGRIRIRMRLAALPLVDGEYTVGLYLVTDQFAGNLPELLDFAIVVPRSVSEYAPYPADYRGVTVLNTVTSVTHDEQTIEA